MLWLEKQEWMACYQYLNRFCVFAMHGVVLQYVMGCHPPYPVERPRGCLRALRGCCIASGVLDQSVLRGYMYLASSSAPCKEWRA